MILKNSLVASLLMVGLTTIPNTQNYLTSTPAPKDTPSVQ